MQIVNKLSLYYLSQLIEFARCAYGVIHAEHFPDITRGRISRHPRYGKAEVLTLGNLYVNELVTCDFKSSSPVTVSLL